MRLLAAIVRDWRLRLVLTAAVAFLAALGGVRLADRLRGPDDERLLDRIAPALALDARQSARLAAREALFDRRRARYEANIARQDRLLAEAIDREHRLGPGVSRAVRAAQEQIFLLQREQIAALLDARATLTPSQAATFDRMVHDALTGQ